MDESRKVDGPSCILQVYMEAFKIFKLLYFKNIRAVASDNAKRTNFQTNNHPSTSQALGKQPLKLHVTCVLWA